MDLPRVSKKYLLLISVLCALVVLLQADFARRDAFPVSASVSPAPSALPTLAPTPTPTPIPGDVDADRILTAADAAKLLRFASGKTSLPYAALQSADLTQNGTIDETDAKVILWLSADKLPDMDAFVETIRTGLCDERDFDRFEYDGTDDDGMGNYRSEQVSITIETRRAYDSVAYVADIFIRDLSSLYTTLAAPNHSDETIGVQSILGMVADSGGILGTNGDYCTNRVGPLARNGEWLSTYRSAYSDICVLNYDGTMEMYAAYSYHVRDITQTPRYQVWGFGPSLLKDDGSARTKFPNKVLPQNPRTVIGYYEVGHYCLIAVDGRDRAYSIGMEMAELAEFCASLGLTAAFNLDGGMTTVMATKTALVNSPSRGGRRCSDAIVIGEPSEARLSAGD